MNKQIIYIAIYRALECIESETKDEKLSEFLNSANPYVFKDRKSADPAIYTEYSDWIDSKGINISSDNSFDVAKKYVSEKTEFNDVLNQIDTDEWNSLMAIIEKEEPELSKK